MGRRGPPAKPTAQKKLEGTYRSDRATGDELDPPPAVPPRPSWLDAEARREWDRVIPRLAELGILAAIDGAMLADYCAAHSLAVTATKRYQKEGLVVKTKQGPLKHPMIKVAQEARAQARLLAGEFGLSAASRTRIKAPPKPAKREDQAEGFLFGQGKPTVIQGGKGG